MFSLFRPRTRLGAVFHFAPPPVQHARDANLGPANMAHIRQSGPDSGLGSQVKVLESFPFRCTRLGAVFRLTPPPMQHARDSNPVTHTLSSLSSPLSPSLSFTHSLPLSNTQAQTLSLSLSRTRLGAVFCLAPPPMQHARDPDLVLRTTSSQNCEAVPRRART